MINNKIRFTHPKKFLYTLIPRDADGEVDLGKTKHIGQLFCMVVLVYSIFATCFYLWRLLWCYDNLDISEFYYGIIASLSSQVAIEALSVAFGVLFIMGAFKQQIGFLFLWLVSVLVLLSLGTVVSVYGCVVRDQGYPKSWDVWSRMEIGVFIVKILINLPAIVSAVALYKTLSDWYEYSSDEREILL